MKNILIIVLSFATIAICAQEKNDSTSLRCCRKSVNGSKEGPCLSVHVKESTERSYIASFKINGYYDTEVLNGGVIFHKLSLGGYSTCGDIGQPELPAITQLLINPMYTDCSVEISDEVWVEHSIGTIYPVLEDLLEGDTIYSLKQLPPELITNPQLVEIRKGSLYRGHYIFSVITCPFRYNPMHNSIEILSEFTIKAMFSGQADPKNVFNLHRV